MRAPRLQTRMLVAGLVPALALTVTALGVPAASASYGAAATLIRIGPSATVTAPAGDRLACGTPASPGQAQCASVLRLAASAGTSIPGYTPAQLRGAYNLASASVSGGHGATVAIVTAYSYPTAAKDLAAYRAHFQLPACTTATGCLRILNEHGGTAGLPSPNASWAHSDATALDAISALCPNCHLMLVEAASNSYADLGTAENTAAAKGARYVLNPWNAPESVGQDVYDHYFNHPGIAIVAASGNIGYGRTFPGDLPYVTSVGGTTLSPTKYSTRHWAEIAWTGSGSGCSALEIKPSWQRADASAATGCPNRTQNDVAAEADPSTGAAVYDSYGTTSPWARNGGTALAAAIVTATYALAGPPARDTYPASYPYQRAKSLNDVLYGSNGPCSLNPDYICNAQSGFDGPTGLGTPNGTAAFSATGASPVTVLDPGTQDYLAGASTHISITGMDSRSGATLQYTASGLPTGLAVTVVPNSLRATITGTLPAAVHTYSVTVTATDTVTHRSGSTRFSLVATGSLATSAPMTTAIRTNIDPKTDTGTECLDAGAETAGTTVTAQLCAIATQQLDWSYVPNAAPGAGGTIEISNLCLALSGSTVALASCEPGSTAQAWFPAYDGGLENGSTQMCLDAGTYAGPLTLAACDSSLGEQQWRMESVLPLAVPGICATTDDRSGGVFTPPPAVIQTELCGQSGVDYGFNYDFQGNLRSGAWYCVGPEFLGYIYAEAGTSIGDYCQSGAAGEWDPLPNGAILNIGTGLCLADPGNSDLPNNQLQLQPCDGALSEIWALG